MNMIRVLIEKCICGFSKDASNTVIKHFKESYSLPFATFNALLQFLFCIWLIIALPVAIVIYLIKSCHKCRIRNSEEVAFQSQKTEIKSQTPKTKFFSHVLSFIRVTLFPRMFPIGPKEDIKENGV